jgi:uncharacterized protein (TIGR00299 family) protein
LIDCQIAGLSGDMLLAALLDLGANFQKIKDTLISAAKIVPDVKNFDVNHKKILKNGIAATQILFSFEGDSHHTHGEDLQDSMNAILANLNWNNSEKTLAREILTTLIRAEAKIHGTSEKEVHLHEAGSIDTLMDIIGFITACKDLNLLETSSWISTPIAIGGGSLKFSHGLVSNPAPATLEILKKANFDIIGGPVDSELTTPTGASILVNMVERTYQFYPLFSVKAIGYGAGTKDFSTIPNVLRIVQGINASKPSYNFEQIITIETNVDDVTGELLGNTANKILETGFAKDISIISVSSKKRPGYLIQILTTYDHLVPITDILIHELGTLGVRFFPTMRYTLNRKIVSIPIEVLNQPYKISVKISWDSNYTIIQTKPESDDLERLSKNTAIPMRQLLQIINKELEKKYPIGQKINDLI